MKDTGTFKWEDETLTFRPCDKPQWEGFTEVVDNQNFIIAVALTPELAMIAANEELCYQQEVVEDFIFEAMGWME